MGLYFTSTLHCCVYLRDKEATGNLRVIEEDFKVEQKCIYEKKKI